MPVRIAEISARMEYDRVTGALRTMCVRREISKLRELGLPAQDSGDRRGRFSGNVHVEQKTLSVA